MDHDETGCQAPPEAPILCVNNCGFFGSPTTMNMCSKCHKEFVLNQERAKIAASSIDDLVNGSASEKDKKPVVVDTPDLHVVQKEVEPVRPSPIAVAGGSGDKPKGPNRCGTCNKRVGLTGFKCKCGDLFCSTHRYSDKHNCSFDYKSAAREAIEKANPVVKAEKLERKI
uniref:Uncharacterized protein n=1 Tax=Kalanchoe fedtschenkoi TaxID=63787 RepID=A0A7N0SWW4_KALFE